MVVYKQGCVLSAALDIYDLSPAGCLTGSVPPLACGSGMQSLSQSSFQ